MQEISTEVKTEWLTVKESSELLGVTVNMMHQYLIRYPKIKAGHTYKAGKRIMIAKAGLTILAGLAGTSRNNYDNNVTVQKKARKQAIVEKGVESMGQVAVLAREVAELKAMIQAQPKQLALQSPGLTLPAPTVEVPELSTRARVKQRIDLYIDGKWPDPEARPDAIHFKLWGRLYNEFNGRYNLNVNARKQGSEGTIDVVDRLNMMEELYALACYLFPIPNDSL